MLNLFLLFVLSFSHMSLALPPICGFDSEHPQKSCPEDYSDISTSKEVDELSKIAERAKEPVCVDSHEDYCKEILKDKDFQSSPEVAEKLDLAAKKFLLNEGSNKDYDWQEEITKKIEAVSYTHLTLPTTPYV